MFFFIVLLISIQNSFFVIKTLYIYMHLFISRSFNWLRNISNFRRIVLWIITIKRNINCFKEIQTSNSNTSLIWERDESENIWLIDLIVKVRIHESLFGQGKYELECPFQHLYAPHIVWTSKTTEKERIFARFLKNRTLNTLEFFWSFFQYKNAMPKGNDSNYLI